MFGKWLNRLRNLMLLWGVCLFAACLIFLFKSDILVLVLNGAGEYLQLSLEPLAITSPGLWLPLSLASMLSLVYMCFYAGADIKRRLGFVDVILVAKLIAVVLFVYFFITRTPALIYLMAALIPAVSFTLTSWVYSRVRREHRLMGLG